MLCTAVLCPESYAQLYEQFVTVNVDINSRAELFSEYRILLNCPVWSCVLFDGKTVCSFKRPVSVIECLRL